MAMCVFYAMVVRMVTGDRDIGTVIVTVTESYSHGYSYRYVQVGL